MKQVKLMRVMLSGFAALFLWCMMPLFCMTSLAMDHTKPQMEEGKFYKEFWEQHALFEDGTFVTSQFLVANFPWPVGDKHGIMIATVVSPDGHRTIIKNGRDLGEWGFDDKQFDIFIHLHRLRSHKGLYMLDLGADDGNEVHSTVISQVSVPAGHLPEGQGDDERFDHTNFKDNGHSMESAFFLPYFSGKGSWHIRDENGETFRSGTGKVQGFGTHVLINGRLDEVVTNWLRVSGLRGNDPQPLPFLSSITRPDGKKDNILTLMDSAGKVTSFHNIELDYQDIKEDGSDSSYPTVIAVKAHNNMGKNNADKNRESLSGTIRLTKKIDHFNINDHLNFFERSFASSRSAVANYRYIADYDLVYVTAKGTQRLNGKALSEYQDILPPKKQKRIKKKR